MLEIIAKETFLTIFGDTKSPETQQFLEFQKKWESLDKTMYSKLEIDDMKKPLVKKLIRENLLFLEELFQKSNQFNRDDYKELAELCFLILGGTPSAKFTFRKCGPIHHARWMSKIIYTFKITLFR